MPSPRIIDLTPLNHLLKMAGSGDAANLMAALVTDLQTTRAGLGAAWNGPDFAALRANAHDLVALAGTMGDTELQSIAQSLTKAANAQILGELEDLEPKTMSGIDDLIHALEMRPHVGQGA